MVGVSLAVYGVSSAVGNALLVGPLIRRFGEHSAAQFGTGINFAILTGYGLVTSPVLALMRTPVNAPGGVVTPALQFIASRTAPADAQGALQGVFASLNAIATIASPLIMTTTFAHFSAAGAEVFAPGAPFLVAAFLTLSCIALHTSWRGTSQPVGDSP